MLKCSLYHISSGEKQLSLSDPQTTVLLALLVESLCDSEGSHGHKTTVPLVVGNRLCKQIEKKLGYRFHRSFDAKFLDDLKDLEARGFLRIVILDSSCSIVQPTEQSIAIVRQMKERSKRDVHWWGSLADTVNLPLSIVAIVLALLSLMSITIGVRRCGIGKVDVPVSPSPVSPARPDFFIEPQNIIPNKAATIGKQATTVSTMVNQETPFTSNAPMTPTMVPSMTLTPTMTATMSPNSIWMPAYDTTLPIMLPRLHGRFQSCLSFRSMFFREHDSSRSMRMRLPSLWQLDRKGQCGRTSIVETIFFVGLSVVLAKTLESVFLLGQFT